MATPSPSPKVAVAQQPPPPNCVDDLTAPQSNNCTSNDVTLALLYNASDLWRIPGELVTLDPRAQVVAGSFERYDIGLFLALDGGDAYTGTCYHDYLPPPLAPEGACSMSATLRSRWRLSRGRDLRRCRHPLRVGRHLRQDC